MRKPTRFILTCAQLPHRRWEVEEDGDDLRVPGWPTLSAKAVFDRNDRRKETLCALVWRGDHFPVGEKERDKILGLLLGDVRQGKSPPKKTGKWAITSTPCLPGEERTPEPWIPLHEVANHMAESSDWAQNALLEAARVQAEWEAEGYDPEG